MAGRRRCRSGWPAPRRAPRRGCSSSAGRAAHAAVVVRAPRPRGRQRREVRRPGHCRSSPTGEDVGRSGGRRSARMTRNLRPGRPYTAPRARSLPLPIAAGVLMSVTWWIDDRGSPTSAARAPTEAATSTPDDTTTTEPPYDGWPTRRRRQPWPARVEGLLTFRGNPTRSFYGTGPVPTADPEVAYRFPARAGCAASRPTSAPPRCGAAWAGPASRRCSSARRPTAPAGRGRCSAPTTAPCTSSTPTPASASSPTSPPATSSRAPSPSTPTGSRSSTPASRDNDYRVISIEGAEPVELWRMNADDFSPVLWNDDWDSSAMIIDDYLFEGGENSQFVIVKLNRAYDAAGKVTVDPKIVFNTPGWDQELPERHRRRDGLDRELAHRRRQHRVLRQLRRAGPGLGHQRARRTAWHPTRTFRFWTGDDTDATVVADDEGMLYVASEYERAGTAERSKEVGQLMKLDPSRSRAIPLVWSFKDDGARARGHLGHAGRRRRRGLRRPPTAAASSASTGPPAPMLWEKKLPGPLWAIAGGRRRRAAHRRLQRLLPRLRRVRPAGRPARAVDARARRLHRGHAGGVGRTHLHRHPGRRPLLHRPGRTAATTTTGRPPTSRLRPDRRVNAMSSERGRG